MCVIFVYKKQFNTVQEALQSGKLKPGCALAFPRGIYWHYAIYLGQFKVDETGVKKAVVIHRAQQGEFVGIVLDLLEETAEGKPFYVFGCIQEHLSDIVIKAAQDFGKSGYNLISKNCEHWVRLMHHGVPWSWQASAGVAISALLSPVLAVGAYLIPGTASGAASSSGIPSDAATGEFSNQAKNIPNHVQSAIINDVLHI